MMPPRHKSGSGFTLIELLCVTAIIGILALAITPSLSSLGQKGEMTKSTNNVASLLELACAHAKANNLKVEVGFRSDANGLHAVAVGAREGTDFIPLSKVHRFPKVRLAAIPGSTNRPTADFELAHPMDNAIPGFDFHGEHYPLVIQFNSRGEARALSKGLSRVIEIGLLVNMHGVTPSALEANFGVVQVTGLSGGIVTYRP